MSPHGPSDSPRVASGTRDSRSQAASVAILVVDDDPVVLELTSRLLTRAGATVTALGGGRAAVRAIADGAIRPAVLITDIDMPEMSGVELAARVAALRPGVRIVMMTGDDVRAAAARAHPTEVAVVLLKPFTTAELLAAAGLLEVVPEDRP